MSSIRDYLDPGGQILAGRLDDFCATLEILSQRLRGTIATIVGDAIGNLVRATAMRILDILTRELPHADPNRYRSQDDYESNYWRDDQDDGQVSQIETGPVPSRLPTALSAGLQAASWWLRRWTGQGPVVTTIAVAIAAAGIAYVGGPIAAAVLGLAGTATQFIGPRATALDEPEYFESQ